MSWLGHVPLKNVRIDFEFKRYHFDLINFLSFDLNRFNPFRSYYQLSFSSSIEWQAHSNIIFDFCTKNIFFFVLFVLNLVQYTLFRRSKRLKFHKSIRQIFFFSKNFSIISNLIWMGTNFVYLRKYLQFFVEKQFSAKFSNWSDKKKQQKNKNSLNSDLWLLKKHWNLFILILFIFSLFEFEWRWWFKKKKKYIYWHKVSDYLCKNN